jgi:hypothetical protein
MFLTVPQVAPPILGTKTERIIMSKQFGKAFAVWAWADADSIAKLECTFKVKTSRQEPAALFYDLPNRAPIH